MKPSEPIRIIFSSTIVGSFFHARDRCKSLVVALNEINADYDYAVIETGEREQLCQFVEDVIDESSVDIGDFANHLGCEKCEVTDQWRDW